MGGGEARERGILKHKLDLKVVDNNAILTDIVTLETVKYNFSQLTFYWAEYTIIFSLTNK